MGEVKFDTTLRDSQGTEVLPVKPEDFDLDAYADYEAALLEQNRKFVEADHGLLVYRRVRANGVFYDKCRDYKESLALQLGALKASMPYKADIANFLEPWYGIGYIASCFGSTYKWLPEQAPSVEPKFSSAQEILDSDFVPIAQTPEGKYNLEMIEYFMDQTKGKVPVSFSDIQSPLNMLTYLLPVTDMFLEIYDDPDTVHQAAKLCADLLKDFLMEQRKIIGDALARPGHGFASSRVFSGVGLSNDTSIMLQEDDYNDIFKSLDEDLGDEFGGVVYHSCGVWEKKIDMVKGYRNVLAADGAFTIETDPSPNRPEAFADAFNGTGIVLNARAVGNPENSFAAFEKLWRPKQKLIAVTYCKTVEEQEALYRRLHEMEGQSL
ncbi:MAG: uroporphyrinogen decarboxylase family protein [Candidatus Limivivens sp.]|nr:uroporphyrinogen decarboxylase family protein [Candidatus Limivivens sp.]